MSTTTSPPQLQCESFSTKLRHASLGILFALVLVVPKILHLRRNPRYWMLCRTLLGLAGAVLVVWPLGKPNSYLLAVIGLSMFVVAILLPQAKPAASLDEKARELGALVVVNGGQLLAPDARPASVQLFVGTEKISALDTRFEPLLVIPVDQITLAHAEESGGCWLLTINWAGPAAQFTYRGIFAEHLARVAETTVRTVLRPALPVLPQRRAASA